MNHALPGAVGIQFFSKPYRTSGTPWARSYLTTALILFSICKYRATFFTGSTLPSFGA